MGTFIPNKLQLLLDVDLSDLGSLSGPIKLVYDDVAEKWKAAADTGGGGTGGGGFLPDYLNAISQGNFDGSAGGQGEHDFVPASTPCQVSVVAQVFDAADGDSITLAVVGTLGEWTGTVWSEQCLALSPSTLQQSMSLIIPPGFTYRVTVAGNAHAWVTEFPAL